MVWLGASCLAAALLARLCAAQASGWSPGQVNTTMCQWQSPRAAVIRDTYYIDGGYLWWMQGFADGSESPVSDGNPTGLVYLLNFSIPFNTSQNLSTIFTTVSKASGGNGQSANNIGPQYYDGGMFANDYEWFTYGGLLSKTDAYHAPAADSVAAYEVYASGPPKWFQPGFILDQLPDGITRYVTDGAAVSVPSENLGFYFGGLRAADYGEIFYLPGPDNASANADVESTTLIKLDMTTQQLETWTNTSLPPTVPGRANAEIAWIPVSKQGLLVAVGGVIYPSYSNINQTDNATATASSEQTSPGFMSMVSVYDIASQIWYEQPTSGTPPGALAQGCSVVASAQDGSSHNIYWYGGFDGLHPQEPFSDDVWVLSVPSFTWTKVKSGTASHARAGHRCSKPYPDQMFVIGGYTSAPGTEFNCVEGGIIQIFNLSSAQWIDSYDSKVWSNYSVPPSIYQTIGGNGAGGATATSPSSGFANATLKTLFGTTYDSTKIKNWYPYASQQAPSTNRTTISPTVATKSSTPAYLAPVLGVVLGLFFITIIVLAFLLYRRRKLLRLSGNGTQSEAGTMDNRRWVSNWIRATPADAKAPTVTTDETPSSPYAEYERPYMQEVGGTQVHEMMDTSKPVELHDTGFVPIVDKHRQNGLAPSPSVTSYDSQTSRASSVSRTSHSPAARATISPLQSPSMTENRDQTRIVSGMSGPSEGHARGISETSVSTSGHYAAPPENLHDSAVQPLAITRPGAVSPVSPRANEERGEYLDSDAAAHLRRSNFAEGLDGE